MDTKDYRIKPGDGKATVATLCGYYKENRGGRVVPIKLDAPKCEYHETNKYLGHCRHFFCPLCRYQPENKDE